MEPTQRPPPQHHYAGLGIQVTATGLDQHGYLMVVDDPENGDHQQVRYAWKSLLWLVRCLFFFQQTLVTTP